MLLVKVQRYLFYRKRKRIEENEINKKIDYIELAAEENFNDEFVKSLRFPVYGI